MVFCDSALETTARGRASHFGQEIPQWIVPVCLCIQTMTLPLKMMILSLKMMIISLKMMIVVTGGARRCDFD